MVCKGAERQAWEGRLPATCLPAACLLPACGQTQAGRRDVTGSEAGNDLLPCSWSLG